MPGTRSAEAQGISQLSTILAPRSVLCLLGWLSCLGVAGAVELERYKTLEIVFDQAIITPANPFETYLLRLEVTDPNGRTFQLDGYYDGDGQGGQVGNVWKARINPYEEGTWSWRTVPGDAVDPALNGLSGQFDVTSGNDRGGLVADGRYFQLQDGSPMYLVGNFLDFTDGLPSTHVLMSEKIGADDRNAILQRQRGFHDANKANIYLANKGDYGGLSVTPWVGTKSTNDKTRMDLSRWQHYDDYLADVKDNKMLADLWFFADDSDFGSLPLTDQQRFIRYAMARTSAYTNTMYTLALEWQEGFTASRINELGTFAEKHNPWERLLSVHGTSMSNWQFAGQDWPTFVATQAGNNTQPDEVNAYGQSIRSQDTLPHVDEEFGILRGTSDDRLRGNLWSNLTSGAAGGGTGSDLKALERFLQQSRLPFQRMVPDNSLIAGDGANRFALAESGHHYLVYSGNGSFDLNLSGTNLTAHWFNPRDAEATLGTPFAVSAGRNTFMPPEDVGRDWVLWITDGANLDDAVIHPSGDAALVQQVVAGSPRFELMPVVAWEFNTDHDREGWQNNPGATNRGVGDGSWNLTMSGADPSLFGPAINEDAEVATIVEIRMSSSDTDANAQLFWTVDGEGSFSEQRSQRFTLLPDGDLHTYQLELSTDPDWTSTITQLRFDPVATSHGGIVSIDSIRLLTPVAVPEPATCSLLAVAAGWFLIMGYAAIRWC